MFESPPAEPGLDSAAESYLTAASQGRRSVALGIVRGQLEEGTRPEAIISDILAAAQVRIGQRWHAGHAGVGEEHRVTSITVDALHLVGISAATANRESTAAISRPEGRLLVTCVEGEMHELPALMAAEVFRLRGFDVTYVGGSMPVDALVGLLDAEPPAAVAVACSMPTLLMGAWATISALRRNGVFILAGGRGFGRGGRWSKALGADAWAGSFTEGASILAEALVSSRPNRRDPAGSAMAEVEVTQLRVDSAAIVESAMREALTVWPRLRESPQGVPRFRDELIAALGAAGSAAIVDDPQLLFDHIAWWESLTLAHGQDLATLPAAFELLIEATPPELSTTRRLLVEALAACRGGPWVR